MAFGDIDNDGDLDLALTGCTYIDGVSCSSYIAKIYINNGTTLTESSQWQNNLTAVNVGSLAFGDIDNDGDLDLALTGCNNGGGAVGPCNNYNTFVYINNGTTLTESSQWQNNLTKVAWSSLSFGDIDNDGDLDLALTGQSSNAKVSKIYINNGTTLTESSQWQNNLTAVYTGSATFGDIDNDGDLDLALVGGTPTEIAKIYINSGTSLIESPQWQQNLLSVDESSLIFGDYDNDGDLDLAYIGHNVGDIHRIYRNNGSTFILVDFEGWRTGGNLTGVYDGSVTFGDYDNDGDLEIITTGYEGYTTLYLYNETFFTSSNADPESHILNLSSGSSAVWADLDNDNDLDLIAIGWDKYTAGGGERVAKVYISNASLTKNNTKPTSPTTNFTSSYSTANNTLTISWGNGSDIETNISGLYYNLMVGNSTTNNTIVSGVYGGSSNPTAGYFGNMMQRKNITLNLVLSTGTYYWYVQTIDTGLAKSNWSARQSFTVSADITPPVISGVSSSVTSSSATITWNTDEMANSTVYYGTTSSTTSFSGDASWTMSHSISLSSLSASTTYYYNVSSCDDSGNCNTSQQSIFATSDEPVTPPPTGGGGGIITPVNKTIPRFDVDFSNISTKTLEAKQGDIKTFSFNNEIKHSITLLTVAIDSITLLITSEPITMQIRIGEIKEIDINDDKINDIEVKLLSIISGKASFLLNKLSGADIVAKEELGKEALFDVKVSISNLFKIVKSGREVIAQIEVFNVNNIGQVDVIADYYITSKEDNKTRLAEGSDTLAVEAVSSFVRSLKIPYNLKSGNYLFNVDVKYNGKIMASGNTEFTIIRNYEIIIAVGIAVFIIAGLFAYLWWIRRKEKKIEEEEEKLKKEIKRILKEKGFKKEIIRKKRK